MRILKKKYPRSLYIQSQEIKTNSSTDFLGSVINSKLNYVTMLGTQIQAIHISFVPLQLHSPPFFINNGVLALSQSYYYNYGLLFFKVFIAISTSI